MCFASNIISHPAEASRGLICRDILGRQELKMHLTEQLDSNLIHCKVLKWFGDRLWHLISKSSYCDEFLLRVLWLLEYSSRGSQENQLLLMSALGCWSPKLQNPRNRWFPGDGRFLRDELGAKVQREWRIETGQWPFDQSAKSKRIKRIQWALIRLASSR